MQSAEERLLCEHAQVPKYLRLGYLCTLDGGSCFLADNVELREKCPTKRLKGIKREAVTS